MKAILLLLGLFNQHALAKLVQRSFNITNIVNSTWLTQETFKARDYSSCSFFCLQNISACAAFSLQDGTCEIGSFVSYMPMPDGLGKKIYKVIPSTTDGDDDNAPDLPVVPIGHIAWFGLGNGQFDASLNATLSPPLTLPTPSALTSYSASYNFYRNNRMYICGVTTDHPNYGSTACYSWLLGDSTGFVPEPAHMQAAHVLGAGVDMGDLGFFVAGGYYSSSDTCHPYTEMWQNGTWTARAQLPSALSELSAAKVSVSKVMIMAGIWSNSQGTINSNTYMYDFNNPSGGWVQTASYPGNYRVRSSAAGPVYFPNGKSYVIHTGGTYVSGSSYPHSNEAYKYDPSTNSWSAMTFLPTAQWMAGSLIANGLFYNWYGNDVWVYSPITNTWTNFLHVGGVWMSGCMPIPYNFS